MASPELTTITSEDVAVATAELTYPATNLIGLWLQHINDRGVLGANEPIRGDHSRQLMNRVLTGVCEGDIPLSLDSFYSAFFADNMNGPGDRTHLQPDLAQFDRFINWYKRRREELPFVDLRRDSQDVDRVGFADSFNPMFSITMSPQNDEQLGASYTGVVSLPMLGVELSQYASGTCYNKVKQFEIEVLRVSQDGGERRIELCITNIAQLALGFGLATVEKALVADGRFSQRHEFEPLVIISKIERMVLDYKKSRKYYAKYE